MVIVWCEEDNPLKDSHIMVLEIQRISVRFMGKKSSSIYQSTTITQTNLSIYLTLHLLYFIGMLQSLHHMEYHRQYPILDPILSTCTRNISPNDPNFGTHTQPFLPYHCGRQTFYRTNYYLYGLVNIVERKRFSVTKKKSNCFKFKYVEQFRRCMDRLVTMGLINPLQRKLIRIINFKRNVT
jgi:hypothetical protein